MADRENESKDGQTDADGDWQSDSSSGRLDGSTVHQELWLDGRKIAVRPATEFEDRPRTSPSGKPLSEGLGFIERATLIVSPPPEPT